MVDSHRAIAGYLRERRESLGLSRAALARRADVSEGLIQKLEQGTRPPTATALSALFDALEVPSIFRDHAAMVLEIELTGGAGAILELTWVELDFLESIPYPACYHTGPTLDLIATNTAYAQAFPGQKPGMSVIEWLLLDSRAREVVEDWEREAHMAVQSLRHLAPGIAAPERIDEIVARCEESPDWHRLWTTDITANVLPWRPVRIRLLDGGEWTPMHVQNMRCEVPRQGLWLYSMVPIREPELAAE
ncbi:helix-turn-helix domain-containing protein [Nocardia huaxiensis]|uniref:Helix-turn-helix domain-containing protein n=1 Tax=Nocardia huaxiensis TaxID=2755382 RepID=A0A7D6VGZ8_9NOCA|nr:helix-turn-helix domain-containing protein [Nocardia huaxiensis]QLY32617.1 helix-turn-helix domain-containing protein [Nocardia huaxiensis]